MGEAWRRGSLACAWDSLWGNRFLFDGIALLDLLLGICSAIICQKSRNMLNLIGHQRTLHWLLPTVNSSVCICSLIECTRSQPTSSISSTIQRMASARGGASTNPPSAILSSMSLSSTRNSSTSELRSRRCSTTSCQKRSATSQNKQ